MAHYDVLYNTDCVPERVKLTELGIEPPGGNVVILFQAAVRRERKTHTDWLADVKLRPIAAQKVNADGGYRGQLKPAVAAYRRERDKVNKAMGEVRLKTMCE